MNILSLFESDLTTTVEMSILTLSFIYIVENLLEPISKLKKLLANTEKKYLGRISIPITVHGTPIGSHSLLSKSSLDLLRKPIRPNYDKSALNRKTLNGSARIRRVKNLNSTFSVGQTINV